MGRVLLCKHRQRADYKTYTLQPREADCKPPAKPWGRQYIRSLIPSVVPLSRPGRREEIPPRTSGNSLTYLRPIQYNLGYRKTQTTSERGPKIIAKFPPALLSSVLKTKMNKLFLVSLLFLALPPLALSQSNPLTSAYRPSIDTKSHSQYEQNLDDEQDSRGSPGQRQSRPPRPLTPAI